MKIHAAIAILISASLITLSACSQPGRTETPPAIQPIRTAIQRTATSIPTETPLVVLPSPTEIAPTTVSSPTAIPPTPTITPTVQATLAGQSGSSPAPLVIGFFVNWDDNSFTSLKANYNRMDELMPEWLHLLNASGAIEDDDLFREQQVLAFLKQQNSNLRIVPLINNYNNTIQDWDTDALTKMLADPQARAKNIQALLDYVQRNQFAGINIDYESVPLDSQANLVTFMQELYATFNPLGLEVSESVPSDDDTLDYPSLAGATDFLIMMAYDQHWDTSDSGPIADQNWFKDQLLMRLSEVPAGHYVIGIGNYGYDWAVNSAETSGVTFQDVLRIASNSNAQVGLEPDSLNPTFNYTSASVTHQVWYLDAVTVFNEMVTGEAFNPRGFAMWVLGSEDPGVWQVFDHRNQLDQTVANSLQTLTGTFDTGTGNANSPGNGSRTITYDPISGLITDEQIVTFPTP